ncbi:MAG: glycosyltransferase [Candidatus Diapherotrites archaeon]|uniref:Glycosyltransferase n=1 Tax=Candidatus Iainarchaeum sp. TaxID=3101447 RepID=A0A8T4L3M9_9ARCH|nr:glycosyltransferase [Candidatus Diapherotrites archaeon]
MKVFVVGPIYPFRGGIAHSNRILCENLQKKHDVTAISFSRMYPKILYPGKEQKEVTEDASFAVKTEYFLDSMNPLTWFKVADRIKKEQPDWVVFQWWHTFFAPLYWTIAKFGKNQKTRFSVVCQNVLPHEESKVHESLTKFFFGKVNYFITLSSSDLQILKKLLPSANANWITESTYETQFGQKSSKAEARKKLGVKGNAILFFGFVRPYKGLEFLLRAMPELLKKKHDLTLMIVGEFWNDKKEYFNLMDELKIKDHLLIVDRYVANDEVPTYFSAADAVVLPYVSSTESGIIQLAYGLNTPVITTAVGGNVDLIEHEKTGLLCRPKDPADLAQTVLSFYQKDLEGPIKKGMRQNADLFRWTSEKESVFFNQKQSKGKE